MANKWLVLSGTSFSLFTRYAHARAAPAVSAAPGKSPPPSTPGCVRASNQLSALRLSTVSVPPAAATF